MQDSWFKNWFDSPYYHLLYFKRDQEEAEKFINNLVAHLQPKEGSRMLDVACGKGRHSRQLAALGFDVTGIDLSKESIDAALEFEAENLHFYRHDMRLPFWINYYDYAFNFFTSFGYFRTQRENDNAIETIAGSIKKNGRFVMDYLNTAYADANMVANNIKEVDEVKFNITKWHDEQFFYKRIEVSDAVLENPLMYTEKVARFTLQNFKDMFQLQGLEIKELFGSYNFEAYDEKNSPRLIMIAEKI